MTESEDPGFKIKIGVGEIAAAEGLGKFFEMITETMIEHHRMLTAATSLQDNTLTLGPLAQELREQMLGLFRDTFMTEQALNMKPVPLVHQYVLYLISIIADAVDMKMNLASKLNALADCVSGFDEHVQAMAAMMGMVAAPSHKDTADLSENDHGETFVTGFGQQLFNVHAQQDCVGWCVIHNPLPGPWDTWPTLWRGDGPFDLWRGFERVCEHGVGHPAAEEYFRGEVMPHGCCGQCRCSPQREEQ